MTQVFKVLTIIFFLCTVTACGVSQNKHQPLAKPGQSDRKHDIHVSFSFDTENDQGNRISGFRLYKEGNLICEVKDPKRKSIDCDFTSPGGSFLFTMTTHFEDGSESPHSEPFSFTLPD
jgi:hypothetical protein